jgi:hypothetical protein
MIMVHSWLFDLVPEHSNQGGWTRNYISNDSFSTARQAIMLWKVRGVIGSISQIVLRKQPASLTLPWLHST